MENRLNFASDYLEGAHPVILQRLMETNLLKTPGYGVDEISEAAREKIRKACEAPEAEVHFLVGGTQANATMIDAFLRGYQGVIAAETGHINVHESGAIEAGGHKVLGLPQKDGKVSADTIREYLENFFADESFEHMVIPGMVYLSQPTEYGTLYSKAELTAIKDVCKEYNLPLYIDGARLAYALACPENDVTLPDLAKLCDAFYIGGTKCGALFGEAVVVPKKGSIPHLFTTVKQHGALLAKGRIASLQFDVMFTDGLYEKMGENGIRLANHIRQELLNKGYTLAFPSPTNQIFVLLEKKKVQEISDKAILSFWENTDEEHSIMRICTSWAAREEEVEELLEVL
ncbi:MAG: low specificity L-threonine aldolase [Lachnospiraceae bacterium]|jgi:threonine aldolase|nr:low specificity L-threonine aldolase [Lachnospiraceae bacterium]